MSTIQTGTGLDLQLEEFLSEVDSITSLQENDHSEAAAGGWIVKSNPVTKSPTYHNIRSGELTKTMPDEYREYLSGFGGFFHEHNAQTHLPSLKRSSHASVRKRRKSAKTNEAGTPHLNKPTGLPQIIGYEDSSGTDGDEDTKRLVSTLPMNVSKNGASRSTQFIGPRLPSPSKRPGAENKSPDILKDDQLVVGANHTSSSERNASPTWKCQSQWSKPTRTAMEQSAQTLLDQFAALDLSSNSLDSLRMRYIQLTTRFEDWQCGKLSSNYFWKKLREAEADLESYAVSGLPHRWNCRWDKNTKRFYYENQAKSTSQWERPDKEPKENKKEGRRKSRIKLVNYEVTDSLHESPTKPQSLSAESRPNSLHSPPSTTSDKRHSVPLEEGDLNGTKASRDVANAKKAHLISQLAEFELACQQMEKELDFSQVTCTIVYDPENPSDQNQSHITSLVPAISSDSESQGDE